jgi:hypothetical protein
MQAILDRRFFELASMLTRTVGSDSVESPQYTVPVQIQFRDLRDEHIVVVNPETTVQDVLDSLYFALDRRVRPYRYLQDWIVVRETLARAVPLIVRGLHEDAPAKTVFAPGSRWQLFALKKPYVAGEVLETIGGPAEVQE